LYDYLKKKIKKFFFFYHSKKVETLVTKPSGEIYVTYHVNEFVLPPATEYIVLVTSSVNGSGGVLITTSKLIEIQIIK
jgi:hypothetical protein